MSERIQMEGHLSEARRKAKNLELQIKTLRDAIRGKLYPYEDVAFIKHEEVAEAAFDLSARVIDYTEILDTIRALKKALGRD